MARKIAALIVAIILLLVLVTAYGQANVDRSSAVVTVADARLDAKYNFGLPRYNDTAQANLNLGNDSCGRLIYTRIDNKVWLRKCSPKRWEELAGGSVSESDPVWVAEKSSYLTSSAAASTYATIVNLASKVNVSDTANMLIKYLLKQDTATMLAPYLRASVAAAIYQPIGSYLTSYTETDPVWNAEKSGYLTAAAAALAYSPIGHTHDFASITSKPSTISGYGITITAGDVPTLNQNTTGNSATATALQTGRSINGVTFDGTANISADIRTIAYQLLGSTIVAHNVNGGLGDATGSQTMVDNRLYFSAVYLPVARTITGVKWKQVTQGNYTADNYNGFGLYSYSGGTLTLVASTTDDGNIWKASSNTIGSKAFSSTYSAAAGIYFIGGIYCNSSQIVAPVIGSVLGSTGSNTINDFTNSAKLSGFISGLTALPSPTQASSGITAYFVENWYGLY